MFNHEILEEYSATQTEIEMLERMIDERRDQLRKLRNNVSDVVKGGAAGKRHFHIQGVPDGSYEMVQSYLQKSEYMLSCKRDKLLDEKLQAETFIESIPNSEIRQIGMLKYIDGRTWEGVALWFAEHGIDKEPQTYRLKWRKYVYEHYEEPGIKERYVTGNI